MNPDIKKKWLKALRDGKYEQGIGYLKSDEGYCCLGVLCDIYIKEIGGSWKEHEDPQEEENVTGIKECMGRMFTPPNKVLEWAGLNTRNPFISFGDKKLIISEWNDGWEGWNLFGKSFAKLADAIEEQL